MNGERNGIAGKISVTLGIIVSILTILRLVGFDFGSPNVDPIDPLDYITGSGFGGAGETATLVPLAASPVYANPGVESVRPKAATESTLTVRLSAPSPGSSAGNPVRFVWEGDPGIYCRLLVYDVEPQPDYRFESGWQIGNMLELSIPNEGIGNLEWFVMCATDPNAGTVFQSAVSHFVFDPFYLNKTRQAGG